MSSAHALRSSLQARRIDLFVVDGQLRVRAPVGVLADADRRALREHRDALIEILCSDGPVRAVLPVRPVPPPPAAGPTRPTPRHKVVAEAGLARLGGFADRDGVSVPPASDVVRALVARGIRLALFGGRLRVTAPAGVLTDEDRAALVEHRDALVAHLQAETSRGRRGRLLR